MHDTTVQVIGMEVVPMGDHAELQIFQGLLFPTPQGAMPIPAGVFRVKMGRDSLIEHGKKMQETGESLAEPQKKSDLVIANSLAGVDEALQGQSKLRGQ